MFTQQILRSTGKPIGHVAGKIRPAFAFLLASLVWTPPSHGIIIDLTLVWRLHQPALSAHVDQAVLADLIARRKFNAAFNLAFVAGNEQFQTAFNALDGVGANVGDGQRFTRIPRADLSAPGQWAAHVPARTTGPNASSCTACHIVPGDDGSGVEVANVHRDPLHSGNVARMIQRNTPHLFGAGGIQRLAEEMTEELHAIREQARQTACQTGQPTTLPLTAKGVGFGLITANPSGTPCSVAFDTSQVEGVSSDLVIRPFQWKGTEAFLRSFNRGAAHNELGMQSVELAGDGVDGDADSIADELTIGDMTALAVYIAAQPRPTTTVELSQLGLIPPLTQAEFNAINRGGLAFDQIGCTLCHVPVLTIDRPTFTEPSQNPNFRDSLFPAGQDPISRGVSPALAMTFDLTRDQPDNRILDESGNLIFRLGSFITTGRRKALVVLYGDLKRHDMGTGLAERIDEAGTGASVFLTENLWGVGTTAPYMHDGRATTLTEAILEHGGEGQASRDAFAALPLASQQDVIAFLNSLVLFKLPEADE